MIRIIGKNGKVIYSIDDWFECAPPAKRKEHWKDYRSAKELAKSWFRDGTAKLPEELNEFFNRNSITERLEIVEVFPEKETKLDEFRNGRKHDLLLIGKKNGDIIVISVEAKADESFGKKIESYLSSNRNENSDIPSRISQLTTSLFGNISSDQLRYQLLYGVAGTLIEAKKHNASTAIFLIHEFQSDGLDISKLRRNANDLNIFVSLLINTGNIVSHNDLIGPIKVPGGQFVPEDIPLYIGKIITKLG